VRAPTHRPPRRPVRRGPTIAGPAAGDHGGRPAGTIPAIVTGHQLHEPAGTDPDSRPLGLALGAVAGLLGLLGCAALAARAWVPVDDDAIIWLRTRDVGTRHTPLLGLYSRYGWSHPGPVVFTALAVPLRLLGGRPSALMVGALVLNVAAGATAVSFAGRTAGPGAAVAMALGVAVLAVGLGNRLIDPWPPDLVVLPLVSFVCAVWAWSAGDRVALPVAAGIGSLLVQAHVSLALPVGAVGAVGAVMRLAWTRVADGRGLEPAGTDLPGPDSGATDPGATDRRRGDAAAVGNAGAEPTSPVPGEGPGARVPVVTIGVLVVLWAPALLQELFGHPANLSQILRFFTHPAPQPLVGWSQGIRLAARTLAPWGPWLGTRRVGVLGAPLPAPVWWLLAPAGVLVLSAAAARVARDRIGLRLVLLVAAGQVAAVTAESRIVGFPYAYLTHWTRAVACLTVVTPLVVFGRLAFAAAVREATDRDLREGAAGRALTGGALAAVAAFVAVLGATRTSPPSPADQARFRQLLPPAVAAVARGTTVRVASRAGPFSAPASSLAVELERHGRTALLPSGSTVRGEPLDEAGAGHGAPPGRVLPTLVVAVGSWLDDLSARPGARVVSMVDPLGPADRQEADRLRDTLAKRARAMGRADLVPTIEDTPAQLGIVAPPELGTDDVRRLVTLALHGPATAVVLLPPTTWDAGG